MRTQALRKVMLAGAAALALGAIGWRVTQTRPGGIAAPPATPADPAAALADLQREATAAPGDADAQRALARALFALGRFGEAAAGYARVTALAPDDTAAWASLGEARTLADNAVTRGAHEAFARALAIDPKSPRARYFLAVEKDVAGDHAGAVADWVALLRDAPPNAPWAQSVRTLIEQVSARERIDVAGKLPPVAADSAAAMPGPTPEEMAAAARMAPSQQDAMARAMVERLAQRLAGNPRDGEGWLRLMRVRLVLGERDGADRALAAARRAFADDAGERARIEAAARTLGVPTAAR